MIQPKQSYQNQQVMDRNTFLKLLMSNNQDVKEINSLETEFRQKKHNKRIKIVQLGNNCIGTLNINPNKYTFQPLPSSTISSQSPHKNISIYQDNRKTSVEKHSFNDSITKIIPDVLICQPINGNSARHILEKISLQKQQQKSIKNIDVCDLPKKLYQRSLTNSQPSSMSPDIKNKDHYQREWRKSVDLLNCAEARIDTAVEKLSQRQSQPSKHAHNPPKLTKLIKIYKSPQEEYQQQRKQMIKMKKSIYQNYAKPFNPPSNLSAYSYIIYEPSFSQGLTKTKQLHTKFQHAYKVHLSLNSRNSVEIASLTKIMTCILAIELCERYKLKISQQIINVGKFQSNIGGTSAKICVGEVYTLQQMLYGLMLPSGNDASIAIAVWGGRLLLSSDIQNDSQKFKKKQCYMRFITEMNTKAKQLELYKTNYANPHGLINSCNKSCSYDIAVLCEYAFNNSLFKQIVSTKNYTCTITAPIEVLISKNNKDYYKNYKIVLTKHTEEELESIEDKELIEEQQDSNANVQYISKTKSWQNTHLLLHQKPHQYVGIKTGVTTSAGPCLASCTVFKGRTFIIIVLGCQKLSLRFKQTEILKRWIYTKEGIIKQKVLQKKKSLTKKYLQNNDNQSNQSIDSNI